MSLFNLSLYAFHDILYVDFFHILYKPILYIVNKLNYDIAKLHCTFIHSFLYYVDGKSNVRISKTLYTPNHNDDNLCGNNDT